MTESTVADTYELEFRMDSCNNKRLLIQQGGNKTSFALETIIDSKAKINSLLASDVLRNFKKLNSVKFNIDLIDTTDRLQECGCLYSESWDKFNKNEYFYANDYETTEYLSINGEQIKIDFTQKNQEYSVIETTYKEENVNGTLRKSGVIRIESSNNFYIEKEFVGECKCN
ncbi:hypothetical protein [Reichenbachiella faecimaris]|uniref:hypothetical protein n=1 Tax=Reichenbachiella faecimaris TaxID=692418 RepID=UPI00111BEA54|nr:hypothetical protein [Reichenbachiella faecimaris]